MKNSFYINNTRCDILHSFNYNNNTFIIYSDGSLNENNDLNVLASKFIIKNNELHLLPVSDNEWQIIDKEWNNING